VERNAGLRSCCSQSYGKLEAETAFWDLISIFVILHQKYLTGLSRSNPLYLCSVDAPFEFGSKYRLFRLIFRDFPQSLQANAGKELQLGHDHFFPNSVQFIEKQLSYHPTLCIPDSLEYWERCWIAHKNNLMGVTWVLRTTKMHRNPNLSFRSCGRRREKWRLKKH
jgi:hypothetical protein